MVTKNVSVSSPMVTVPETTKPTGFYKTATTPRGYALFNYTCGLFMAMGLWNGKGKVFQEEELTRFYATDSVVRHHKSAGNLEETKTGLKISKAGWEYFKNRLTGSEVGQKRFVPEAEAIAKAVKSGKLEKSTMHFAKSTNFVQIIEEVEG